MISLILNVGMIVLLLCQWLAAGQTRKEILVGIHKFREKQSLSQQESHQIIAINNERILSEVRRSAGNGSNHVEHQVKDLESRHRVLLALVSEIRGEEKGKHLAAMQIKSNAGDTQNLTINVAGGEGGKSTSDSYNTQQSGDDASATQAGEIKGGS